MQMNLIVDSLTLVQVLVRQQAITWTNGDKEILGYMESPRATFTNMV